jgi:hypothetical protein
VKYATGVEAGDVGVRPIVAHSSIVAHDRKTGGSSIAGMGCVVQLAPPSVVVNSNGFVSVFGTSPTTMQVSAVGQEKS